LLPKERAIQGVHSLRRNHRRRKRRSGEWPSVRC
jgi:hypothetical protein